MKVRIRGKLVDVLDRKCGERNCFALGFDKGTYAPGRGYTSYHNKQRPVCWTRHLDGCPSRSICPSCRTLSVDPPGSACGWCRDGSITVAKEESKR
jgi:hypothetical protein